MTIKQFAESRRIPQSKVKQLALELLGEVPTKFSEEQIAELDKALALTTEKLLESEYSATEINPEEESKTMHLSLKDSSPLEITERVKEILGSELLKRNALLYVSFLKQSFNDTKFQLDVAVFQIEQDYYNKLQHHQHNLYEDGKLRIRTNNSEVIKMFTASGLKEEILKNPEPETASLLAEALEFFESIE